MILRYFNMLALLGMVTGIFFNGTQVAYSQVYDHKLLPTGAQEELQPTLKMMFDNFNQVTSQKQTVMGGLFELYTPQIEDYFSSDLPRVVSLMETMKFKLYEKSRTLYMPGSEPEKVFKEEAVTYLTLYVLLVKTYVQAMHNDGNDNKEYRRGWKRIESLKPRFHQNNYDSLALDFQLYRLERNTDKNYFEVMVSDYQIMAFESAALKQIYSTEKYAKSVHFHALQSMLFMHMGLQNLSKKKLNPETVIGGSCAANAFLTFQNPLKRGAIGLDREQMTNLPIYQEAQNYEKYMNFYYPYTHMFTKAAIDSGIFDEEFIGDYIEHLEKRVPKLKKYLVKHVFPYNKEKNKEVQDDVKEPESYTEWVSGTQKWVVKGYKELLLGASLGDNLFSNAIRAGDKIDYKTVYEETFKVAYDGSGNILDGWVAENLGFIVPDGDRVKHFDNIVSPAMEATMEFYNIREAHYKEKFSEQLDKIEGLQHLEDENGNREAFVDFMRERKLDKTVMLAKDAMPSAYLINMINDDYLGLQPKDEVELQRMLSLIKVPRFNLKDECDLDECSIKDYKKVLAKHQLVMDQMPLPLLKAKKVLPVDPPELVAMLEKKMDQPRFGRLYTTIKYEKKGQKLWDYFQKKVQERVKKYKVEILKEHNLSDFIKLAEEQSDTVIATEKYFYKKIREVLPKQKRIDILWKSAVEEARKIRIGFVRRKICEEFDTRHSKAKEVYELAKKQGSSELANYASEVDHNERQLGIHRCFDKNAIENNYMSDEEIAKMSEEIGYDMHEDMTQSFLFDPFEKAREMFKNKYRENSLDLSLLSPENQLGGSERNVLGGNLNSTEAYSQEFLEVVPEQRYRKGWWGETWLAVLNIGDIFIPGDAVRDVDWSNWWYKLVGESGSWFSFGKQKTYGHKEFFYETEKEYSMDMQQEYVNRELMRTLTGDDSYLLGQSEMFIFDKDSTEAPATDQQIIDSKVFEGTGIEVDQSDLDYINDDSQPVNLTQGDQSDITLDDTLIKRVTEEEKQKEKDEMLALFMDAYESDDIVIVEEEDDDELILEESTFDFAADTTKNFIDLEFARTVQDSIALAQSKLDNILEIDSGLVASDATSRVKIGIDTASKVNQLPELTQAQSDSLAALSIDTTLVIDPKHKSNLNLPLDKQIENIYDKSVVVHENVKKFTGDTDEDAKLADSYNDKSDLTNEEIQSSYDDDPLTARLMKEQDGFKNRMLGIVEKTPAKFGVFTGEASIFEQKDMLELVKVTKEVINGMNYFINHYTHKKMDLRGQPYGEMGETFNEMLKLYGLFEVVEMEAPLDEFDFAPTLLEQYLVANTRVRMAQEGSRLLGVLDTAPSYSIQKDVERTNKLLGLSQEEIKEKKHESYVMDRREEEDGSEYDERALILRLAEANGALDDDSEDMLRIKLNNFIDKAILNVQGKLANFCKADPLNYMDDNNFSAMIRNSGGIRKYLYGAQNVHLDPMQRNTIKTSFEPDLKDKAKSSTQKFYEAMDYIGIAVLIISVMISAALLITGSGGTLTAPIAMVMRGWWGVKLGWLSPMNLFFTFYFIIPNVSRIVHTVDMPSQIRYQRSVMVSQILEPTGNIERGVGDLEEIEAHQEEYNMNKWMAPLFLAIDVGFAIPVVRAFNARLGRKAAKIVRMNTGKNIIGYFKSEGRNKLRYFFKNYKEYLRLYRLAIVGNEAGFMHNGEWVANTLRLAESTTMNSATNAAKASSKTIKVKSGNNLTRFLGRFSKFGDTSTKTKNMARSGSNYGKTKMHAIYYHMIDNMSTIRAMFTKEGYAALRTMISGSPILDKNGIFYVVEKGMSKVADETGWKLADYAKEVKHRLEHLKKSIKVTEKWQAIYKDMDPEEAFKKYAEAFDKEWVDGKEAFDLWSEAFPNLKEKESIELFERLLNRDANGAFGAWKKMHPKMSKKQLEKTFKAKAKEIVSASRSASDVRPGSPYVRNKRPFSERLGEFMEDPRYSWRLWTKGMMSSHTLLIPMKLFDAIKREGWKGFTRFFRQNSSQFVEVNTAIHETLKQSADEFNNYDFLITQMSEYLTKHPELIAKNASKGAKSGAMMKPGTTFETEMDFFLAMSKKYGQELDNKLLEARAIGFKEADALRSAGHSEEEIIHAVINKVKKEGFTESTILSQLFTTDGPRHAQVFMKHFEDMARFNYTSAKKFRRVFNDQKYLLETMEPFGHSVNLEYFKNNLEYGHVYEAASTLVNGKPRKIVEDSYQVFNKMYEAEFIVK